jgi:hypothetical protein
MTAYLLPVPKLSWRDGNGLPLVGGTVETYVPNTTTLKDTWRDREQTTLNAHPIVLDSRGETVMWGNGSYRLVVKDAAGNLIYDQVSDVSVLKGDPGAQGPSAPNSFYVTGADATGVADSSAAIQASIDAAAAAGGGTVYIPAGTFKVATSIRIRSSGVKLQGVGRGAPHDISPLDLAATKLIWAGANGGHVIECGPVPGSGAQKLTDIAVTAICLESGLFPYSTAAGIGLLISSVQNSVFDVFTFEFTEAAVAFTVSAPLGEAGNCEGNTLSLRFRQINTSGTALQLGGNGSSNTCHNLFPIVYGYINAGFGIDFQDADNNRLEQVWIDRVSGGTGINLMYRGTRTGMGGGRTNIIQQFSQSVHTGLIFSEGYETAGVSNAAYGNAIERFDNANVAITTQTGTGASFYWSSNLWGSGMREAATSTFEGRRQFSDGTILFWGTGNGNFGAAQENHIVLPFGCQRILSVWGTNVGHGQVPPCWPDATGNGFILYSPSFGQYTYAGIALATQT